MAEDVAGPWEWPLRRFAWLEVAWVGFAIANLVGMWLLPTWETVPFHFIWVSLTLVYGFRVWSAVATESVLTIVVVLTGAILTVEVLHGDQPADELTEVPLMACMFLAMVWHVQHRLAVTDDLQRISQENLRLLRRERQFIQDASHELRTPITIALGHAELLARESQDPERAEDAHIVVDELLRLRRLADRLLLLASSADSGPGIAMEQLECIFDRFTRLDTGRSRDWGGLGLGLAIVKAIVEAHGGSVQARSTLGQGSVFEILLPLPRTPLGGMAK